MPAAGWGCTTAVLELNANVGMLTYHTIVAPKRKTEADGNVIHLAGIIYKYNSIMETNRSTELRGSVELRG